MTTKTKFSIALNSIIFVLLVLSPLCVIYGVKVWKHTEEFLVFFEPNIYSLKYYTVDSNVFGGLLALVYIFFEAALAKGKIPRIPKILHLLRLAATTGLTLTMLVVACFLIPMFGKKWYLLYTNINFLFHLVIPLLSVITFIFFEPDTQDISLKDSLFGIITMATYAVFYTINVFSHLGNGHPLKDYDWYGFLGGKITNVVIAIPLMLLITWSISLGLWIGNRKLSQ